MPGGSVWYSGGGWANPLMILSIEVIRLANDLCRALLIAEQISGVSGEDSQCNPDSDLLPARVHSGQAGYRSLNDRWYSPNQRPGCRISPQRSDNIGNGANEVRNESSYSGCRSRSQSCGHWHQRTDKSLCLCFTFRCGSGVSHMIHQGIRVDATYRIEFLFKFALEFIFKFKFELVLQALKSWCCTERGTGGKLADTGHRDMLRYPANLSHQCFPFKFTLKFILKLSGSGQGFCLKFILVHC